LKYVFRSNIPCKRGYDRSILVQKSQPDRVVLPESIDRSDDLLEILAQASRRLNIESVPDCLDCREDEYDDIYYFIEEKLKHKCGGTLFLTGCPGTG